MSENKGTIVYIGGFELPDKNAAAHRVVSNSKILRDLGYNVVLIGVKKDESLKSTFSLDENKHFGFECWSVSYPKSTLSWLKYIVGESCLIEFLKKKCSHNVVAVICYNYPTISQLRIRKICHKNKVKIFSDTTEWYDSSGGNYLYRIVKWIDTASRMYYSNMKTDGLITTSKYLTDLYVKKGKLTLELPTLYDSDTFISPDLGVENFRKKFIYVGVPFEASRVNKNRNNLKERLDISIEVFSQLYSSGADFEFNIYGIGGDEYLRVFPEHKGLLDNMSDCVRFHGRQPHAKVLKHIASSHFSIFFRDETRVTLAGFPSKLAESITCGTPVIANKMLSIEGFADFEGLFLAEKGQEKNELEKVMKISEDKILELKKISYESRRFHYSNFQTKVSLFLRNTGVEHEFK